MKVISFPGIKPIFVWAILVVFVGLLPAAGLAQQTPPAKPKPEAEAAFKQGVEAFEKNDYKTANDKFTAAIKLDNTFSEAYYYRGRVGDEVPWFVRGTTDDYTAAIKLNPNYADAYLRRGDTEGLDKKPPTDDFTTAIRIKPDFAEAYYQRAAARWNSVSSLSGIQQLSEENLRARGLEGQKKEQAIARFNEVIRMSIADLLKATEINPQYVQARTLLAALYFELEEHEKAVTELTRVIAISPDAADVYYRRGLAYLKLNQDQKADQDFTASIRLSPNEVKAYNKRVIARFNLENFEGALNDYIAALKLRLNYSIRTLSYEPDNVLFKLENFDEKLPGLTKSAREKLADAYHERALATLYSTLHRNDDLKESLADLTKALGFQPLNISARYQKGLVLANLGNHPGAIDDFSEVIRVQPQSANAYYARGVSRKASKDNKGALDDFSRSIELSPEFAKAYYERGQVFSQLGDQRSAIADFTRAVTGYPEFVNAYYLRARAEESSKEFPKAIADYLQVVRLANPGEKNVAIEPQQLNANLAVVYYRGLARLHLVRERDKKNGRRFLTKNEALARKNLLELAEKDFTTVITRNPAFANAYYQRGRARETVRLLSYDSQGSDSHGANSNGALADFARAIQLNPRYAEPYLSRGEYFRAALKPRLAILDFTRVTQIDPTNAKAFYDLGEIYSENFEDRRADPNASLNFYNLAIKADPAYVDAYLERAYLLEEKAPLKAIDDYTRVIQFDPENTSAYRRRADLYEEQKDQARALADYTTAIDLDPSEPGSNNHVVSDAYIDRAFIRYSLGDGKGAQEDYRQAVLITPCLNCTSGSSSVSQANKADSFLQRGLALLRRGDKQGSRQNLEQAAKLFYTQGDMPKYESVKYHLSRF